MYICSFCSDGFDSIDKLICHLQCFHRNQSLHSYECKQENCPNMFTNITSFKRHLNVKHPATNLPSNLIHKETELYSVEQTTSADISILNSEPQVSNEIVHSNMPIINFEDLKFNLQKSALNFTLNLHGCNNITRKDVLKIQFWLRFQTHLKVFLK